jgi:hypothetical protein
VPAGSRFEARLASRLAGRGPVGELLAAIGVVAREELRHPARILITGVVSSAAVGVGVTLLALRRGARRHAGASHQPAQR